MTCGDKLRSSARSMSDKRAETNIFYAFCHLGAASRVINAQRQIMVILRRLSFRFHKLSDEHAETNYGHHVPFVIRGQSVERWAETNYGHSVHLVVI